MSVKFTDFSGLQTDFQTDLLSGQDTWCISLFFRLEDGSTTNSDLMNCVRIMRGEPRTIPTFPITMTINSQPYTYTVSPIQYVFDLVTQKASDPSLMGFYLSMVWTNPDWPGAYDVGLEWLSSEVSAFKEHHILFGRNGAATMDNPIPPKFYLDGVANGEGQDEGVLFGTTATASKNSSDDQAFAIRLGNLNMVQRYPFHDIIVGPPGSTSETGSGFKGPYPSGTVIYSLGDVALWQGWFPTDAQIIQLRDRSKLPTDLGGSALQSWWKLDGVAGAPVSGADTQIENAANPGTYDLSIA